MTRTITKGIITLPESPAAGSGRRAIAWCFLFLCSVVYVVHGIHDERLLLRSLDFKTLYGCARCLTHGCDPYDSDQVYKAYMDGGGEPGKDLPAFRPHEPVYMPPALAMMTPFTILRWQAADRVWLCFSTAVFLIGVWLIASFSVPEAPLISAAGIGLLLLGNTMPFMLAQPAQLVSGLCAIAVWCFLQKRYEGLGVVSLAVALAFKPHVAGLVWLYFLLAREYRRRAVHVLVVTVLLCVPGIAWMSLAHASSGWLHEMRANLAALSAPGQTNYPGPSNPGAGNLASLQSIVSTIYDNPHFFMPFSRAVGVGMLVVWLIAFYKAGASRNRDTLGLASVVLISMLPIYHRDYDIGLLLLIFPAAAMLQRNGGAGGRSVALATVLAMVPAAHDFQVLALRFLIKPRHLHLGPAGTIIWLRSVSWAVLLLALLYLACFYSFSRQKETPGAMSASI